MSILVLTPGLQTTVQAGPRRGFRHQGVPASGAADPLSLALANRLVGNDLLAPALEASLVGPALRFEAQHAIAITGGDAKATLNSEPVAFHRTLVVNAGDDLVIGSLEVGMRVYVAFGGGLQADAILGSTSTYLPAAMGGLSGRALEQDDVLLTDDAAPASEILETPDNHRPPVTPRWALRACRAAETRLLQGRQRSALFENSWIVGRRADRMGMQLEGATLDIESDGRMPSAGVFPGTIQCPEDGAAFILGVDAGTTGGYPRVAQIARCDRHLLGQLRPGDHVQLLPRQPQEAIDELLAKHDYWRQWLPGIERII
jgi:biotin-dependent carboxylase-like uncharacterized protein